MMRQPSTHADLYRWWREALADPAMPRHDGIPECGFYRTRMVRGGPWVPVEIFVDRDIDEVGELAGPERLHAVAGTERRNPVSLWLHLEPISREDHAALVRRMRTDAPMAAYLAPVDLTSTPRRPSDARY